jgi:N6-L-threonylcarbamoyladenine synthase
MAFFVRMALGITRNMHILGIESSCDDTSVALVKASSDGFVVLSEKTASQIDLHAQYGGVVPEIAGRLHAETITALVEQVLVSQQKPDVIAVTAGPGLITGLIVGVEAARTLSYAWRVPLVGVNHIAGHAHSPLIQTGHAIKFPALCLVVSGGHTELLFMHDHTTFDLVGKTRDDAAGEAFDKIAKAVGLSYPGGPAISKKATHGNPHAITFPRPMLDSNNHDMSFAGLKTAARYWLDDHAARQNGSIKYALDNETLSDFSASYQQAIVDVLVKKTVSAMKAHHPRTVILCGGVSANTLLQESLRAALDSSLSFLLPEPGYYMDNGAMIAVAAHFLAKEGQYTQWKSIKADPNWKVYDKSH